MLDGRRAFISRRTRGGFTLVELMIVVAIVGVLAVIGVVGYRKIVLNGKVTEARGMISAIRIAQESYKTERGVYADIGPNVCPATAGTVQRKFAWTPACDGGIAQWTALPVHSDGAVQFGYTTRAGTAAIPALVGEPVPWVSVPAALGNQPWFFVTASADLDGNGPVFTQLVGSSWENTIHVTNEGL